MYFTALCNSILLFLHFCFEFSQSLIFFVLTFFLYVKEICALMVLLYKYRYIHSFIQS